MGFVKVWNGELALAEIQAQYAFSKARFGYLPHININNNNNRILDMASYTIVTSTAANVAGNTNTLATTKVKVVANAACVYAIDAPATLSANVGAMIPANFPTYINMGGIGKKISVLPVAGASTLITVTECGTVYQSAVNQNSTTFLNT